jgi:cell division septum initiation protein DivIVA
MSSQWLREQALAQQKRAAARQEKDSGREQAKNQLKELINGLIEARQRCVQLAQWHAERCARIVELKADLKAEWERRVAAEQQVAELRQQLTAGQNGHAKPAKTTVKVVKPTKRKAGTRA